MVIVTTGGAVVQVKIDVGLKGGKVGRESNKVGKVLGERQRQTFMSMFVFVFMLDVKETRSRKLLTGRVSGGKQDAKTPRRNAQKPQTW